MQKSLIRSKFHTRFHFWWNCIWKLSHACTGANLRNEFFRKSGEWEIAQIRFCGECFAPICAQVNRKSEHGGLPISYRKSRTWWFRSNFLLEIGSKTFHILAQPRRVLRTTIANKRIFRIFMSEQGQLPTFPLWFLCCCLRFACNVRVILNRYSTG